MISSSGWGVPPLHATDPAEIQNGIIKQRRRQLFLQSHRLGDMVRYGLPFPTGIHPWKLTEYGNATCFVLPNVGARHQPEHPFDEPA